MIRLHSSSLFRHRTCGPRKQLLSQSGKPKPFSEIPTLPMWRLLYNMTTGPKQDPHKPFDNFYAFKNDYGDVVCIELPGQKMVLTYNADDYQTVLSAGGKYPGELQVKCWLEREKQLKKKDPNYSMNLIALTGEEWRKNRTPLDQHFLMMDKVDLYMPLINDIAGDFVGRLKGELNADGKVQDLKKLMYGYSVEGIGGVIFDQRLNVLSDPMPENAKRFLDSVLNVFDVAGELENTFPFYKFFKTPKFNEFNNGVDEMFKIGSSFIEDCDSTHKDNPKRIDLVHNLRSAGQSEERVLSNAVTMFLAGSDSTTHTIEWLLHNLGRNPDVQEKLRQNITSVLKDVQNVTPETMKELSYLKACLKESMRLTPSAPGVQRLAHKDVIISGYQIPKGTVVIAMMWVSNKDANFFPNPDKFIPERWIDPDLKPNPWYSKPFGFGPRMCQGVRIAELETYVLMTHLLRNFSWESLDDVVEPWQALFVQPEKPLNIKWKKLN